MFLSQGVIPLGGCVVAANENMGMPFAIVINLEDFTVRPWSHIQNNTSSIYQPYRDFKV